MLWMEVAVVWIFFVLLLLNLVNGQDIYSESQTPIPNYMVIAGETFYPPISYLNVNSQEGDYMCRYITQNDSKISIMIEPKYNVWTIPARSFREESLTYVDYLNLGDKIIISLTDPSNEDSQATSSEYLNPNKSQVIRIYSKREVMQEKVAFTTSKPLLMFNYKPNPHMFQSLFSEDGNTTIYSNVSSFRVSTSLIIIIRAAKLIGNDSRASSTEVWFVDFDNLKYGSYVLTGFFLTACSPLLESFVPKQEIIMVCSTSIARLIPVKLYFNPAHLMIELVEGAASSKEIIRLQTEMFYNLGIKGYALNYSQILRVEPSYSKFYDYRLLKDVGDSTLHVLIQSEHKIYSTFVNVKRNIMKGFVNISGSNRVNTRSYSLVNKEVKDIRICRFRNILYVTEDKTKTYKSTRDSDTPKMIYDLDMVPDNYKVRLVSYQCLPKYGYLVLLYWIMDASGSRSDSKVIVLNLFPGTRASRVLWLEKSFGAIDVANIAVDSYDAVKDKLSFSFLSSRPPKLGTITFALNYPKLYLKTFEPGLFTFDLSPKILPSQFPSIQFNVTVIPKQKLKALDSSATIPREILLEKNEFPLDNLIKVDGLVTRVKDLKDFGLFSENGYSISRVLNYTGTLSIGSNNTLIKVFSRDHLLTIVTQSKIYLLKESFSILPSEPHRVWNRSELLTTAWTENPSTAVYLFSSFNYKDSMNYLKWTVQWKNGTKKREDGGNYGKDGLVFDQGVTDLAQISYSEKASAVILEEGDELTISVYDSKSNRFCTGKIEAQELAYSQFDVGWFEVLSIGQDEQKVWLLMFTFRRISIVHWAAFAISPTESNTLERISSGRLELIDFLGVQNIECSNADVNQDFTSANFSCFISTASQYEIMMHFSTDLPQINLSNSSKEILEKPIQGKTLAIAQTGTHLFTVQERGEQRAWIMVYEIANRTINYFNQGEEEKISSPHILAGSIEVPWNGYYTKIGTFMNELFFANREGDIKLYEPCQGVLRITDNLLKEVKLELKGVEGTVKYKIKIVDKYEKTQHWQLVIFLVCVLVLFFIALLCWRLRYAIMLNDS